MDIKSPLTSNNTLQSHVSNYKTIIDKHVIFAK